MRQTHPEVNYVLQPAAGIANYGTGNRSTAAVHFAVMRTILSKQLHAPVLDPLVPSGFGLFGSTTAMSEKFDADLKKNLDPYPNARVLFVSHSFGGLLSGENLIGNAERDRFIGAITLGTPHLGVDPSRWGRFDKTVRNLNSFAADVRAAHEADNEQTALAMVATTMDVMVPCESALPDIAGKQRHVFAYPGTSLASLGNVERHLNTGIDHNGLVLHPQAVMLVAAVARQMIKEQSSTPSYALA